MTAEKRFPDELPADFGELLLRIERKGPLKGWFPRILILVSQPLLGALPHRTKKELERAVGFFFNTAGATGMNILLNMILYPVILLGIAAGLSGVDLLFSQSANSYILLGIALGFAEGAYRLREGLFQFKPPGEMSFGPALYGIPLSFVLTPLLERRAGIVRSGHVPVDGFYKKGFDEKLERERRYGNVYTLEDWGSAYYLRLEFPRVVPDIGLSVRTELPDEMPDYDYSLLLKDGHLVIRGRCSDERVRKISGNVGAFPAEFTTVIPLREKVEGLSHRYGDKILEILLLKAQQGQSG